MWIATFGPAGHAPLAPGTVGSAAAVVLYLPLAWLGPFPYLLGVTLLTGLGIWAAEEAERAFGQKDDGRIVIDEVVGQLLTWAPLAILPGGDGAWGGEPRLAPFWLLGGFVAFRGLDIWKPGPVRWAERRFQGGAGVVLDDAIAGLIGALALGAGFALAG